MLRRVEARATQRTTIPLWKIQIVFSTRGSNRFIWIPHFQSYSSGLLLPLIAIVYANIPIRFNWAAHHRLLTRRKSVEAGILGR